MPTIVKTNISKAYWFSNEESVETCFRPAIVKSMHTSDNTPEEISWFDKLFEGGIFIPKKPSGNDKRALTILITGPPGSGKSTLAMELCYRLTRTGQLNGERINALYLTSESDEQWLIQKAKSFKWPETQFVEFGDFTPRVPYVTVWQTSNFRNYLQIKNKGVSLFKHLIKHKFDWKSFAASYAAEIPERVMKEIEDKHLEKEILKKEPHLLVVDSLNTIESKDRARLFDKFIELATCGPRIMVLIIDTAESEFTSQYWEFLADNVIRLDRINKTGYMIRTIEIVKARYQSHIWGKHQLKIYSPYKTEGQDFEELRRAHPYRREGGIFIFPSIHYYLSSYKRRAPRTKPISDRTKLTSLNEILHGGFYKLDRAAHSELSQIIQDRDVLMVLGRLTDYNECDKEEFTRLLSDNFNSDVLEKYQSAILKFTSTGGFPRGRCNGFIGCRGGHKSHLGYIQILSRVINYENEKGLIISLRDDEGMARKTMSKILKQEFPSEGIELLDLEREGKIEIIYYPPGYITPEEFFHRMFLSIQRMKNPRDNGGRNVKISLLFNSLDQLSSRFPLCAKEDIFVPGIIETLSAEDITSYFVAVEEPGQPEEQYGLLSMADVIIKFSHQLFKRRNYCGHLNEYLGSEKKLREEEIEAIKIGLGKKHPAIVMRVVRFAGGQAAGAGGILDLINRKSPVYNIYKLHDDIKNEGLYFTPFSPKYPQEGESEN